MSALTFKKLAAQYCAAHSTAGMLIRFSSLSTRGEELLAQCRETRETVLKKCGIDSDDATAVFLFERTIGIKGEAP
jgi:hypothetical protein